jgi:hypothetical protein
MRYEITSSSSRHYLTDWVILHSHLNLPHEPRANIWIAATGGVRRQGVTSLASRINALFLRAFHLQVRSPAYLINPVLPSSLLHRPIDPSSHPSFNLVSFINSSFLLRLLLRFILLTYQIFGLTDLMSCHSGLRFRSSYMGYSWVIDNKY